MRLYADGDVLFITPSQNGKCGISWIYEKDIGVGDYETVEVDGTYALKRRFDGKSRICLGIAIREAKRFYAEIDESVYALYDRLEPEEKAWIEEYNRQRQEEKEQEERESAAWLWERIKERGCDNCRYSTCAADDLKCKFSGHLLDARINPKFGDGGITYYFNHLTGIPDEGCKYYFEEDKKAAI